jgi:hypothetical protein
MVSVLPSLFILPFVGFPLAGGGGKRPSSSIFENVVVPEHMNGLDLAHDTSLSLKI